MFPLRIFSLNSLSFLAKKEMSVASLVFPSQELLLIPNGVVRYLPLVETGFTSCGGNLFGAEKIDNICNEC